MTITEEKDNGTDKPDVVAVTSFEDRHKQVQSFLPLFPFSRFFSLSLRCLIVFVFDSKKAELLAEEFAKSALAPLTQQVNVKVPPPIHHDKKRAAHKAGFLTQVCKIAKTRGV